jgi:hypothetical protein
MPMSRNHQTTQVVWIFHRTIHNLVLWTVGVMHLAHKAFEVFDFLNMDLTRFVEQRNMDLTHLTRQSKPLICPCYRGY